MFFYLLNGQGYQNQLSVDMYGNCIVPNGVTEINGFYRITRGGSGQASAFNGYPTNIELPATLITIGNSAFSNCRIKKIDIPSSVLSIGEYAFQNNEKLEEITIPSSVKMVEKGTFKNCKELKKIKLPEGLTYIGEDAFSDCNSLEEIILPKGLTYIGKGAFSGCNSLHKVVLSGGLPYICEGAFSGCQKLKELTMPIAGFGNCQKVNHIKLPEGLTYVSEAVYNLKDRAKSDLELASKLDTLQSTILATVSSKIGEASAAMDTGIGKLEEKIHGREVVTDEAIESLKAENLAIRQQLERQTKLFNDTISDNKLSEIGKIIPELEQQIKEQVCKEVRDYETKKANIQASDEKRLELKEKIGILDSEAVQILHRQNPEDTVFCMPDWVCKVSSGAFEKADWLEMVKIGKNVRVICKDAFKDCKNLTDVNGFDAHALTNICDDAFSGCNNVDADFPEATIGGENQVIIASRAFPESCSVRGGIQSKNPLDIRVKMPFKQLNSESNKGQSLPNDLKRDKVEEQKKNGFGGFGGTSPKTQMSNGFGSFGNTAPTQTQAGNMSINFVPPKTQIGGMFTNIAPPKTQTSNGFGSFGNTTPTRTQTGFVPNSGSPKIQTNSSNMFGFR